VFGNSRVEAEGIDPGGIIRQDMKTIKAMVVRGAVAVVAVVGTAAILLPGIFGLGIYRTVL
jgi:hypothetical protein